MSDPKAAPTQTTDPWIGDYSVKGYELLSPLGDGALGRKVKALHSGLKRLVAMRLLPAGTPDDVVEAFRDRAKAISALHHPNVVAALDAGTCPESGVHFLAMEFLEGPSLLSYLEEQGQLPEPEAIAVCQAVCEALVCLEEATLKHGDLRPGNILLDADWTPKLSDVGDAPPPSARDPIERARCMAPELLDDNPGDIRSDLYGLGVVLFRALTGRYPFDGVSWADLVSQHQVGEFPFEDAGSKELASVLRGLCDRDPERRYETAQQANLDLVRVMTGHPPEGVAAVHSDTESFRIAQNMGGKTETNLPPLLERPPVEALDRRRDTSVHRVANFEIQVRLSSRGVTLSEYSFNQNVIGIGRSSSSDIHIDNPIVSRRHAEIRRKEGGVYIKARSSTNVTSLNGKSVKGEAELKPGDLVIVSDKFHIELSWDTSAPGKLHSAPDELDDKTPVVGTRIQEREKPSSESSRLPATAISDGEPEASPEPTPPASSSYAESPYAEGASYAMDNPYDVPGAVGGAPTKAVARREKPPTTEKSRKAASAEDDVEPGLSESAVRRISAPPQGYLVYQRRGRSVRSFVDKGFQVGSSSACDLRLPKGHPRKAALIVRGVDAYRLYNVAPEVHMVTLNGEPVPDRAVLEDGDEVGVCGANLLFAGDDPDD